MSIKEEILRDLGRKLGMTSDNTSYLPSEIVECSGFIIWFDSLILGIILLFFFPRASGRRFRKLPFDLEIKSQKY